VLQPVRYARGVMLPRCTRALGGVALAAMPRLEIIEAAAPASRAVENARRFIIMVSLLRHAGWWEG
jgi:hypothetical protein